MEEGSSIVSMLNSGSIFLITLQNSQIIISVIILIVLILASAMISGSEIAFFSLNRANRDLIKGKKGKEIRWLWNKPEKLLATILISNNFVNVAIVIIAAWLTNGLFDFKYDWIMFLVDVIIITSILILFGELMPKIMANIKPVGFSKVMSNPLRILFFLFSPFSNLLIKFTTVIDKKMKDKIPEISREDLSEAIDYSAKISEKDEDNTKLLKGIVTFGEKEVKEIMKSRMDVMAIEDSMEFDELINMIKHEGFSRYPTYKDNFDKISGVLHVKDLLGYLDGEDKNWQIKIRPTYFVPENKKINELLKEFQEKKNHFAVVVDEYGGTSGIVTMEDVIEEIVGEISDEFDELHEEGYKKVKENVFEFEAKTTIIDFCRVVEIKEDYFKNVKGDADTIAGLILEKEEKIPEKFDEIEIGNVLFKIIEVDNRRIKKVAVIISEEKK